MKTCKTHLRSWGIAMLLLLCVSTTWRCAYIMEGLRVAEMMISTINALGRKDKILADCAPAERGVDLAGRRYIDYACRVGSLVKTVRVMQADLDQGGEGEPDE